MSRILPRATPESVGIPSSAVAALAERLETNARGVHSLMIVRHGRVAAEAWWSPNRPEAPQMLFSLAKSFTSTAVGLAIAEGHFRLDDPVISFFPDRLPPEVGPNLAAMRVRHLLTMSAGHTAEVAGALMRPRSNDWVGEFLALPVENVPGTSFVYSTGAGYILSAIVQKTTGETLVDYLAPRLFEPLGIERPYWESDPEGINAGGYGLYLRTEDIAAFGQLYLQNGLWNGRRLVPEEWVRAATSVQIANGPDPNVEWAQGYGYQFWMSRHGYRGDGAFGQYCLVIPEQDMVVALTSGSTGMHAILQDVWSLLPALSPGELPDDPAAQRELVLRLRSLRLEPPSGQGSGPLETELDGVEFAFVDNPLGVRSVRFELGTGGGGTGGVRTPGALVFGWNKQPHVRTVPFGWGRWLDRRSNLLAEWTDAPMASAAAWPSPDRLRVDTLLYATPFRYSFTFTFDGPTLVLDARVNMAFGPTRLGVFIARR